MVAYLWSLALYIRFTKALSSLSLLFLLFASVPCTASFHAKRLDPPAPVPLDLHGYLLSTINWRSLKCNTEHVIRQSKEVEAYLATCLQALKNADMFEMHHDYAASTSFLYIFSQIIEIEMLVKGLGFAHDYFLSVREDLSVDDIVFGSIYYLLEEFFHQLSFDVDCSPIWKNLWRDHLTLEKLEKLLAFPDLIKGKVFDIFDWDSLASTFKLASPFIVKLPVFRALLETWTHCLIFIARQHIKTAKFEPNTLYKPSLGIYIPYKLHYMQKMRRQMFLMILKCYPMMKFPMLFKPYFDSQWYDLEHSSEHKPPSPQVAHAVSWMRPLLYHLDQYGLWWKSIEELKRIECIMERPIFELSKFSKDEPTNYWDQIDFTNNEYKRRPGCEIVAKAIIASYLRSSFLHPLLKALGLQQQDTYTLDNVKNNPIVGPIKKLLIDIIIHLDMAVNGPAYFESEYLLEDIKLLMPDQEQLIEYFTDHGLLPNIDSSLMTTTSSSLGKQDRGKLRKLAATLRLYHLVQENIIKLVKKNVQFIDHSIAPLEKDKVLTVLKSLRISSVVFRQAREIYEQGKKLLENLPKVNRNILEHSIRLVFDEQEPALDETKWIPRMPSIIGNIIKEFGIYQGV